MQPIELLRRKTDWAKQHIMDLEAAIGRYRSDPDTYVIRAERDSEIPQIVNYRMAEINEVPVEIRLICGDAVHNLRGVLDHLACQLVRKNGKKPNTDTSFPIYSSKQRFESEAGGKIHLMHEDAIKAIKGAEPYKRGKGESLFGLNRLDIANKHHMIFVFASSVKIVDALPNIVKMFPQMRPFMEFGYGLVPDKPQPLEKGSIIYQTFSLDGEVDDDIGFSIDVTFGEPGIFKGESVIETVKSLADVVDDLITDFSPLL